MFVKDQNGQDVYMLAPWGSRASYGHRHADSASTVSRVTLQRRGALFVQDDDAGSYQSPHSPMTHKGGRTSRRDGELGVVRAGTKTARCGLSHGRRQYWTDQNKPDLHGSVRGTSSACENAQVKFPLGEPTSTAIPAERYQKSER